MQTPSFDPGLTKQVIAPLRRVIDNMANSTSTAAALRGAISTRTCAS